MDKTMPLVEGAVHHTYEYQGWKIRAAFLQLDGPAVRMDFQKFHDPVIKDYELQAIMTVNTPAGMSWRRSDGAIQWSRSNLIVRLELPIARE